MATSSLLSFSPPIIPTILQHFSYPTTHTTHSNSPLFTSSHIPVHLSQQNTCYNTSPSLSLLHSPMGTKSPINNFANISFNSIKRAKIRHWKRHNKVDLGITINYTSKKKQRKDQKRANVVDLFKKHEAQKQQQKLNKQKQMAAKMSDDKKDENTVNDEHNLMQ